MILGSSGLLGRHLYNKLKKNKKIKLIHNGLKKRRINFTNRFNLEKIIISNKPDIIINTTGLTNLEKCEKQKKFSKKINYEIIDTIFKIQNKKNLNFKLIQISTDQLYNNKKKYGNTEKSKIHLINNYCIHKRMAEISCLKNNALIFRTNFFGKSLNQNKSFSDWIISSFKTKKKLFLFDDVHFNPLRIETVVNILSNIIKKKLYNHKGIYNLGSKDGIFKNEFAILIAKKMNIYHNHFVNINVNSFLKVKRPVNMFMNVSKFEKEFHIMLPKIKNEIKNEIRNYKKNENQIRK